MKPRKTTAAFLAFAVFLILSAPSVCAFAAQKADPQAAVNIPDVHLSEFLHQQTGIPVGKPILAADLEALRGTLEAKNLSIANAEGIQYCVKIEKLDLSGNELSVLPDLSGMERLKSLDLSNNLFSAVPEGLFNCPELDTLALDGNDIRELPALFSGLKELDALTMPDNALGAFPDVLLQLSLETLDISGNPIGSLPDEISVMKSLRVLNAADCSIADLPGKLYGMSGLRKLNVSYNALSSLSEDIAKLESLESLNISGNNLESLPAGLCTLPRLKILQANDNALSSLPAKIGDARLEELSANKNSLSALPSSVADIRSLKKLDVRLNRLTKLPAGLNKLDFNYFDVEWNFLDMSENSPVRKALEEVKAKEECLYSRQLTPVKNLTAVSNPDSVMLSWTPCAGGDDGSSLWTVAKYLVYTVNGDNQSIAAEVFPPDASFTIQDLSPASIYTYKVAVEYEVNDPPSGFEGTTRHTAAIEVRTADAEIVQAPLPSPAIPARPSAAPIPHPPAAASPVTGESMPDSRIEIESTWLYIIVTAAALLVIAFLALAAVHMLRKKQ